MHNYDHACLCYDCKLEKLKVEAQIRKEREREVLRFIRFGKVYNERNFQGI